MLLMWGLLGIVAVQELHCQSYIALHRHETYWGGKGVHQGSKHTRVAWWWDDISAWGLGVAHDPQKRAHFRLPRVACECYNNVNSLSENYNCTPGSLVIGSCPPPLATPLLTNSETGTERRQATEPIDTIRSIQNFFFCSISPMYQAFSSSQQIAIYIESNWYLPTSEECFEFVC